MPVYDTTMEEMMAMMSKLSANREADAADSMCVGMVEHEMPLRDLLQRCGDVITVNGTVPEGINPDDVKIEFSGLDAFLVAQALNITRVTTRVARVTAAAHIMGCIKDAHVIMNQIENNNAQPMSVQDAIASQ